jgi:hypothetical protein
MSSKLTFVFALFLCVITYSCKQEQTKSSPVITQPELIPQKDSSLNSNIVNNVDTANTFEEITLKDSIFMGFYQYMPTIPANRMLQYKYTFYLDEKGDSINFSPTLHFYQSSGKLVNAKNGIVEDDQINNIEREHGLTGFKGISLKGQLKYNSYLKLVKLYQSKYGHFSVKETSKKEYVGKEVIGTEEIEKPLYFSYDNYMLGDCKKLNDNIIRKLIPQKLDRSWILKQGDIRYDYHINLEEKFKTGEYGMPSIQTFKAIPIMEDVYENIVTYDYYKTIDGNKYVSVTFVERKRKSNRQPSPCYDHSNLFKNSEPTYECVVNYFFIDKINPKELEAPKADPSKLKQTLKNI